MSQYGSSRPTATREIILNYAIAALAVAVATGAAYLANVFLSVESFVSLLLCAVLFASWFGGFGPGLTAVVLSVFTFDYFLISPNPHNALRILFFAIAALFVAQICAMQRRAAESLRRARDDLKRTVSDLDALNKSLKIENAKRTEAEQIAREAELDLQVTIDTIPAVVARYRRDGSPDFVNKVFRAYAGLPQDCAQGKRWAIALHPEDVPPLISAWLTHLPTGQPFEIEQRIRRADGEYRWFLSRRVPLRDGNGEVIRWYGASYDIEDRKRAERALRRSEGYLAEAQWLSRTGSFSWTIGTENHYWSKETYRIWGFDETVKPTTDLVLLRVHPDDRKRVEEEHNRALRGERDYDYEHRLLMPDGTIKYVHVRAHRQVYETGEAELVGALMDVTAAKRSQEALQTAQAELAHVTRVTTLGEMSTSIAHEVNQPLAAIVSNAEATLRWLDREIPDIEEARAATRLIVKGARRAEEVIHRIRDFAKKANPQMTKADLNEVVEDALTLVEHEALRHGVAIRSELASGLPVVRGDRIQLQQVIVNLAVNGMEAMAMEGDRRRVLIVQTKQYQSDRVLVAVVDAGVGVEPDNLSGIFNPYHTTKPHGLGMGLSICRSIIESHGGQIWASCNEGPGMTFQFAIPAGRQHD